MDVTRNDMRNFTHIQTNNDQIYCPRTENRCDRDRVAEVRRLFIAREIAPEKQRQFFSLIDVGRIKARRTKKNDGVFINLSAVTARKQFDAQFIRMLKHAPYLSSKRATKPPRAVNDFDIIKINNADESRNCHKIQYMNKRAQKLCIHFHNFKFQYFAIMHLFDCINKNIRTTEKKYIYAHACMRTLRMVIDLVSIWPFCFDKKYFF